MAPIFTLMYSFFYIDAFTSTPFEGNPCAVFPSADGLREKEMRNIAKETNSPETSFVFKTGKADFKVRYFTPRSEVPFAGHPTIATAFILAKEGRIRLSGRQTIVQFEFNIGVLPVQVITADDGSVAQIGMRQLPPKFGETLRNPELAGLIGLESSDFIDDAPVQVVSTGVPFLMVPLKKKESVARAEMNRPELKKILEKTAVQALFVFAPEGFTPQGDTFARLLDPDNAGEDPYTGSATGCMSSYLYHYGIVKKPSLVCEQGHIIGRPGVGKTLLAGTPEDIREVHVFGEAVASLKGTYER